MTPWTDRSAPLANLLNPAVVSAIESRAASEYSGKRGSGLPWTLAFVVAPLVLHEPTRKRLPATAATHLSTWVLRNTDLRAAFPLRALALAPYVREGLRFGIRYSALELDNGALRGTLRLHSPAAGELRDLLTSAALVGRWLARTEAPATVMAVLGVRP